MGREKNLTKGNKRKEPKIKVLAHELLASTLSYLMLAPCWYTNPSNLSSQTPLMSSLVVICLLLLPVRLITSLRIGASAGLRCICPNHLKWCCTSFSSTGDTPSLSRMSSFRTRSLLVWPQIHRSMRISATLSCWTCHILVGQHSTPYNMADRIAVL
jgi:hypothetical protein